MNETQIRDKIKEVEKELVKVKISLAVAGDYFRLVELHRALWDLLYFKVNQEENCLLK
jgi:hypothetical protein